METRFGPPPAAPQGPYTGAFPGARPGSQGASEEVVGQGHVIEGGLTWIVLVDVLLGHGSDVAMECPKPRIVICWFHAAVAAVSVVAMFCPVVAKVAIALSAADRTTLIEPEEILANVTDVCAVVAIAAPAGVLPVGSDAGIVAKLAASPRGEVAIDGIARHRRKQLDMRRRIQCERKHVPEGVGHHAVNSRSFTGYR